MDDNGSNPSYTRGQKIRVVDGPLAGFRGVISEFDGPGDRLTVELLIFGRTTQASVSPSDIEADR